MKIKMKNELGFVEEIDTNSDRFFALKRIEFLENQLNDQRHQICEEIRETVKYSAIIITDKTLTQKEKLLIKEQFDDDKETIYDILDRIEKGE